MKNIGIQVEIKKDLEKVEDRLSTLLKGEEPFLSEIHEKLLKAKGKRIRPLLVLLFSKFKESNLNERIDIAAAIELVHMATLVHDDVIDNAHIRRGEPTIYRGYGKGISILMGDYLFAKAFEVVSHYCNKNVIKALSTMVREMCEGEINQIVNAYNVNQTLEDYFKRIEKKTALFIQSACAVGAYINNEDDKFVNAVKSYGYNIGMAFQVIDDVMDLTLDKNQIGKPVGKDIVEGILTLPILYTLENDEESSKIKEIIQMKNITKEQIDYIYQRVESCGGIKYSLEVAENFIKLAKESINYIQDSNIKNVLFELADYTIERKK